MSANKPICTATEIARWFVNRVDRESGDIISHLKLQKLVYYAQAWYLANFEKPLFDEEIEAWTHGPVVQSVWNEYKQYGWDAIPAGEEPNLELRIKAILELIFERYGDMGAKALENMTHREEPWRKTRGNLPLEARCNRPIKKETMRDYYGKKIGKVYPPKNQ